MPDSFSVVARNWTLEGSPIEDGMNVLADVDEVQKTYPGLDIHEYTSELLDKIGF